METYFNWLRFIMLVTLVTHVVPGTLFAQSAHPNTTQIAPARPSTGDDDWTRAPKVLQTANSWRTGDTLPPELQRRFNLGIWYFDVPSAHGKVVYAPNSDGQPLAEWSY